MLDSIECKINQFEIYNKINYINYNLFCYDLCYLNYTNLINIIMSFNSYIRNMSFNSFTINIQYVYIYII